MGVRTSHPFGLVFPHCQSPEAHLIGQQGVGFLMAMQTVEWERSAPPGYGWTPDQCR